MFYSPGWPGINIFHSHLYVLPLSTPLKNYFNKDKHSGYILVIFTVTIRANSRDLARKLTSCSSGQKKIIPIILSP